MPVPLLTTELLSEYEDRLGYLGVDVEGGFGPGLAQAEMAAAVAPLRLELSAEARVWWGWRNGFVPGAPPYGGLIAPGCYLVSLHQAVRDHAENRALAEEREPGNAGRWWDPLWIPILSPGNGTTIGCDCSVSDGEPSPLHVVWWKNPDDDAPRRTAESLGQMVAWWLAAIDAGVWGYDRAARRWTRDWEWVPPEREGLV